MDTVFIRELRVDTVIGAYAWERQIRQTLVLDLEMGSDVSRPAEDDDLSLAVDYKAVSDRVIEWVSAAEFVLVETLAHRLAMLLITEFDLPWIRLTVGKPGAVPQARTVGVTVERHRAKNGG